MDRRRFLTAAATVTGVARSASANPVRDVPLHANFFGPLYYDDKDKENALWDVRESGLGATAFVPGQPDTWPGWEDAGIPPDKLGDYQRIARVLRAAGVGAEVFPEAKKVGQQLQYAERRGFRLALIAGPDEFAQGTWKIKGQTLCLTLTMRKQKTTTECYEIWRWKDHIEYRDNGATVMTGFVRQERRSTVHPPHQSRSSSRGAL